ncbi:MAG: helix-turn-helix domain-containing protein, partial [Candidatus Zixiibacteriota bacterium]
MGHRYKQFNLEERCEISRLSASGCSIRQIASTLDRSPSTVARELKRNGSKQSGYQPAYADQQSRAHR